MISLPILQPSILEEDKAVFSDTGEPIMSPSQHEKKAGCDAAWGFRYIDGLKGPEKASAAKGVAIHAIQEGYFKNRILPQSDELGCIALCGLKYCPHPSPLLAIEHYFALEVMQLNSKRYWERGKIDIYDPLRAGEFETEHLIGAYAEPNDPGPWLPYDSLTKLAIPLVIDHKSTGDFKWMKTDAILRGTDLIRGDPQPAIYGWKACLDFQASHGQMPPWVHFRWIYYLTKKGDTRAKCIDLRMTPEEIKRNLLRWLPDTDVVAHYYAIGIKTGNDLPKAGGEACKKFGGCEFGPPTRSSPGNLNICRLSDGLRFSSAMTQNPSLASQVNGFLAQNGGGQQQPTQGGMFGGQAAATQQPAATGGMFGGQAQPTPPSSSASPGSQGGMFGGQTQQQPSVQPPAAQGGMFGGHQLLPAPSTDPMAGFSTPAAAQPAAVVDPRLMEIPANIPPDRRVEWLKHCDTNNLDHRNGQVRTSAAVAVIPQAQPVTQESNEAVFKQQALVMYQEGRVPNAGTHPDVIKAFSAIVLMMGAKTPEQLQAANGMTPAATQTQEAPKTRRKRRTAAEMNAANGTPQGNSPLAHPDVIAFIKEFRDFLDSFLPE